MKCSHVELPCIEAARLVYGPVAACDAVYDSGAALTFTHGNPRPGEWALSQQGRIFLGGIPHGPVTAMAVGKGLVPRAFRREEVAGCVSDADLATLNAAAKMEAHHTSPQRER